MAACARRWRHSPCTGIRFVGRTAAPAGPLGTGGLASEHEDIRVRLHPASAAIAAAVAGQYPNSVTAIALLWLAAQRDALRARWLAG